MEETLRIYNSMIRAIQPFVPMVEGKVGMYVCGMTVYDYCHIGHARAMITFDVVYRYLRLKGYDVTYVRNHTDVDDKIINRAERDGVDPLDLSARFITALDEDLAGLGLLTPTAQPKVSDHIPEIIALIGSIIDNGHAYEVDGDVYFAVESYHAYGQLSGRSLEDSRHGDRIAVDERKRHPSDFALWKATRKESEPSWPSPWGPGRPGWHIECSAMSQHYLGATFDLHGGGGDLLFPHHENEIAQSEAGSGEAPFVRCWLHNGMVNLGEEKMSKSIGNIITIREIMRQYPGETLKLLYLEHHYRSPVPYSSERLGDALIALDRLYQAREVALAAAEKVASGASLPSAKQVVIDFGAPGREFFDVVDNFDVGFRTAMDEDFNTSQALGLVFDLVRHTNRFAASPKARQKGAALLALAHEAFRLAASVLGVGEMAPTAFFEEMKDKRVAAMGLDRAWVEERLLARAEARNSKDWSTADEIRVELDERGIIVMDGPEGSTWRIRV